MPFKLGEIVHLKQDPDQRMLVVDLHIDWVVCRWFDGQTIQQSAFSNHDVEADISPLGQTAPV
ncbi:hypothetical protein C4E04_07875 [Microvirga sp. 17 mud 1-3]|nr:hypothetical protein C4E04_07875 [Microvirga sp. 17 mud 1-3]